MKILVIFVVLTTPVFAQAHNHCSFDVAKEISQIHKQSLTARFKRTPLVFAWLFGAAFAGSTLVFLEATLGGISKYPGVVTGTLAATLMAVGGAALWVISKRAAAMHKVDSRPGVQCCRLMADTDGHIAVQMIRYLTFGNQISSEIVQRQGKTYIDIKIPILFDGVPLAAIEYMVDISELHVLRNMGVQNEMLRSFKLIASSVGHELNNSILATYGFYQFFRDDPTDPRNVEDLIDVFGSEFKKMKALTKLLLDFRNLAKAPDTAKPELLDINETVESVVHILTVSGLLKRFDVHTNLESTPTAVVVDRIRFQQVIQNLIINATHAMNAGGTLTITSRTTQTHIELRLEDTGTGISPEILPHVFEPFFTTKGKDKGTGLGLYISKQIIEQASGTVTIESEVGRGTTIIIRLPIYESTDGSGEHTRAPRARSTD